MVEIAKQADGKTFSLAMKRLPFVSVGSLTIESRSEGGFALMASIGFSSPEEWQKEYEVATITRPDLSRIGLSVADIDTLTDSDMAEIASRMAGYYLENGSWEDLQLAYEFVTKGETHE